MFFRHLFLTLCLTLLTGCGVIDYYFLPPPEDTAQELYENANDAMREKRYTNAAEYYMKIKDNFPFSPYAVEAELSLGDAYYLNERFVESAEAYKEFESLHPRHEAIPYVLYQVGMSDLNSFISVDRPTTMVQEAVEYFGRLKDQFPDSEYTAKAAEQVHACRKIMAEHELYLGDMFWQMNNFGPAWKRYTYVVDNFSDVPEVSQHAKEKSIAAYYRYQSALSEWSRENIEGSWKRMFDWM